MSKLSLNKLIGKTILIGLTYSNKNNEIADRYECWGTVIQADNELIVISRSNGETFSIPSDLSSIKPARKGEYHLRSTGEVVVDPDYTSVWHRHLKD